MLPADDVTIPGALEQCVFLKACRLEKTAYTPVWLMRQAGRYLKGYRAIREKVPFLALCKDKDLAAEVTVESQKKIGADAAIIFSDILLVVEPMGFRLSYEAGEGPSIQPRIQYERQVEALISAPPQNAMGFVFDAIREARRRLNPHIPLIGFIGAPFTLASYLLEGGKSRDFKRTKTWIRSCPDGWRLLMEKLTEILILFSHAQIDAGVQAVQIFDSWVGCLSRDEYRLHVLPYSRRLIRGLNGRVPVIHFGTGTKDFLDLMAEAGGEIIGVDSHARLDVAWKRIGYERGIQGNLNPKILFGDRATLRRHVKSILRQAGGRPGHIFNLGHGVLPETPAENVIRLIEMVHTLSKS